MPYSPWSERARWALELSQLPHQRKVYTPLLGEVALKAKIGWSQRASVPVLLTPDGALTDSLEIGRYADKHGGGWPLFPADLHAQIAEWNHRSNAVLEAARGLALPRIAEDPQALLEMIPRRLRPLAPIGALALSRYGVLRTIAKYHATAGDAAYLAVIRENLAALRGALGPDPAEGPTTLLGRFTFADITAAQMLVPAGPHHGPYLRIAPRSRFCWTVPEFAEEFSDLLRWRDALYDRYRRPTAAPPLARDEGASPPAEQP
ncbi:MAG: glutathione S-transferase [Deltaproteobacteria bacterium]|nr:glutathione S-transferase [Deltaproteobacteria bacterium]